MNPVLDKGRETVATPSPTKGRLFLGIREATRTAWLLGGLAVLQVLNLQLPLAQDTQAALSNLFQVAPAILAAAILWQLIAVARATRQPMPGWGLIAVSASAFALGTIGFAFLEVVLGQSPYPGFPDLFFIASYPAMVTGLLRLPAKPLERRERVNTVLDTLALVVVTSLVLYDFTLRGLVSDLLDSGGADSLFSLLYALLDVLLLFVLFGVLLGRLARGTPFRPILLLAGGCFCLIFADVYQGYLTTAGDFASGTMADIGWSLFSGFTGWAGLAQLRQVTDPVRAESAPSPRPQWLSMMLLTYVWIGVMLVLLLYGVFSPGDSDRTFVNLGAITAIGLVVVRQIRGVLDRHSLAEQLDAAHQKLREDYDQLRTLNLRLTESETRLKTANDAKDRFLSIIGHDLKNPLQVIVLASGIAQVPGGPSREELMLATSEIARTSKRMAALLEELLAWARSQRGHLEFKPRSVPLRPLIDAALDLHQQRLREKQITLSVDCPADILAYGDPAMLHTVLRNLVSNATKFTPSQGTITLTAHIDAVSLRVAVRDTGVGMTADDLGKLFRLDVTPSSFGSREGSETGLGLILCHEFVTRHGGRIWAESTPGMGSTFQFTIPAEKATVPGAPTAGPEA